MNPEIMENIDPDENIFNELYNKNISNFCSISDFSNLCKDNPLNYTILNYNIQSFHANRDNFFSMSDDSCLPDIIVLTKLGSNLKTLSIYLTLTLTTHIEIRVDLVVFPST